MTELTRISSNLSGGGNPRPPIQPKHINQFIDYLEAGGDGQFLGANGWVDAPSGSGSVFVDALDYGPITSERSDATANTTTINAAIVAADAMDGYHSIQVPGHPIPINGPLIFPYGVGLVGAGKFATRFVAESATARFEFDTPSEIEIGGWTFDGEDLATEGIFIHGNVNQLNLHDVQSKRIAGRSFHIHAVQNSFFSNLSANYSTYGMEVVDGCGSVIFAGLQCGSNEYFQLKIGEVGEVESGYNQPYLPVFIAPMLEFYSAATSNSIAAMVVTGVSDAWFINPVFGGPYDKPAVHISVDTANGNDTSTMTFSGGGAIGGEDDARGYYISGQSSITFVGRNSITGALTGVVIDGTAPRIIGAPEMNNVGTEWTYLNSANYYQNRSELRHNPVLYMFEEDNTYPVLEIRRPAGTGPTMRIYSDAKIEFGSGLDVPTDTNLYRYGNSLLKTDDKFLAAAGIGVGNSAAATTLGTVTRKMQVFDANGDSLGFIPVYNAIT